MQEQTHPAKSADPQETDRRKRGSTRQRSRSIRITVDDAENDNRLLRLGLHADGETDPDLSTINDQLRGVPLLDIDTERLQACPQLRHCPMLEDIVETIEQMQDVLTQNLSRDQRAPLDNAREQ